MPLNGLRSLWIDTKEMTDEYEDWFKEFVESYRCRICKVDLTLDNFGGVGNNHMVFCRDCKNFCE